MFNKSINGEKVALKIDFVIISEMLVEMLSQ